jgi:hypothetical protein
MCPSPLIGGIGEDKTGENHCTLKYQALFYCLDVRGVVQCGKTFAMDMKYQVLMSLSSLHSIFDKAETTKILNGPISLADSSPDNDRF